MEGNDPGNEREFYCRFTTILVHRKRARDVSRSNPTLVPLRARPVRITANQPRTMAESRVERKNGLEHHFGHDSVIRSSSSSSSSA